MISIPFAQAENSSYAKVLCLRDTNELRIEEVWTEDFNPLPGAEYKALGDLVSYQRGQSKISKWTTACQLSHSLYEIQVMPWGWQYHGIDPSLLLTVHRDGRLLINHLAFDDFDDEDPISTIVLVTFSEIEKLATFRIHRPTVESDVMRQFSYSRLPHLKRSAILAID